MLSQAELNFYGFNKNNILARAEKGHIKVKLFFDPDYKLYVVERKTPRTLWRDRFSDIEKAKKRYLLFLYCTNAQLERMLKNA